MADRIKRTTRERMARTGERYTTARKHVLDAQRVPAQTDAGEPEAFPVVRAADLSVSRADDLSGEELIERFNDYLDTEGNPWHLNAEELTLELADGSFEVSLDYCRTSAETLDWISQVASKSWATNEVLAGLVRALDIVLDPQTHLCSDGVERGPVDWLPEDIEEAVQMSGTV